MGEYGRLLKKDIHTKSRASEIRDDFLENKAAKCFDMSNIPKERIEDVSNDVCLQKVLDKSGIKIREGFRFQIPFSGRLSNFKEQLYLLR